MEVHNNSKYQIKNLKLAKNSLKKALNSFNDYIGHTSKPQWEKECIVQNVARPAEKAEDKINDSISVLNND